MAGSASATSAKYLDEIKSIYERLQGEYDYLRQKQHEHRDLFAEDNEAEDEKIDNRKELLDEEHHRRHSREAAIRHGLLNNDAEYLYSEDVETITDKVEAIGLDKHVDNIDNMLASSVEEMYHSENTALRERISQLEADGVAKSREWRRIRSNFEQLQEANEKLKQQLSESQDDRAKLQTRYKQLMSRFTNLQNCREGVRSDKQAISSSAKSIVSPRSTTTITTSSKSGTASCGKVDTDRLLSLSLEILAEVAATNCVGVVRQPRQSASTKAAASSAPTNLASSTNLIFALAELFRNMPPSLANQTRLVEPLLCLFYDSLPWLMTSSAGPPLPGEENHNELRPGIHLSLQKCGETLFRMNHSAVNCVDLEGASASSSSSSSGPIRKGTAIFFRSSQLTTRFLSTLIILRTVTRADILAQALDSLLRDCRCEAGQEAFVRFDAARVIVMFLRPHNKAFVGISLAIIASLLTASSLPSTINVFTELFLTERFVCALSMLLDSPTTTGADLEKLSVILAKLASTARRPKSVGTAQRLFNAFGITDTIQKMLKRLTSDTSSLLTPLTCSNLRHVISSLTSSSNSQKPPPTAATTTTTTDSSIADDISCGSLSFS